MAEILIGGGIRVPSWVQDLDSFRRWTLSEEFPEEGEIAFLNDTIWVDPAMERDLHNQIKTQCLITIGGVVNASRLGRLYADRMRLVHPEAGLSAEPDALFASKETLQRQRVQLRQGEDSLELV